MVEVSEARLQKWLDHIVQLREIIEFELCQLDTSNAEPYRGIRRILMLQSSIDCTKLIRQLSDYSIGIAQGTGSPDA